MTKTVNGSYIIDTRSFKSRLDDPILFKSHIKKEKPINAIKESVISDDSQIKLKPSPIDDDKKLLLDEEKNAKLKISEGSEIGEMNQTRLLIEGAQEQLNDPIFGEKFEDQMKRLKKNSPFGSLSSWKLFKVIVKSGEDLRQEQFATQLINEFNQIFKSENIEVWLKPYEILATGVNCGIIECVPNSVSLDYLKRKAKNFTTLRQFYEQYFGDTNEESKN